MKSRIFSLSVLFSLLCTLAFASSFGSYDLSLEVDQVEMQTNNVDFVFDVINVDFETLKISNDGKPPTAQNFIDAECLTRDAETETRFDPGRRNNLNIHCLKQERLKIGNDYSRIIEMIPYA
jgi:hypothetical protein